MIHSILLSHDYINSPMYDCNAWMEDRLSTNLERSQRQVQVLLCAKITRLTAPCFDQQVQQPS
jgi:hypothetical protein